MTTRGPLRKTTALVTVFAFGVPFGLAAPAPAQTAPAPQARLQIDHDPLTCVTTVAAPLVEAKVVPGPDLAASYVYFRAAGTPYFYYVVMAGPIPEVQGILPRPLPETRALDYFVQATDKASLSRKTMEYAPPVVPTNVCKVKGLGVGKDGAGLTVGMTDANAPVLPPGFNKDDIVKVILVTGVVVSAAAALSGSSSAGSGSSAGAGAAGAGAAAGAAAAAPPPSSGGGGNSTALIVGGLIVAGGVAAGIALSNNKTETPVITPTRTPTATPVAPTPTRTPVPNRFIQAEATWSGLGDVNVRVLDPSGNEVGQRLPANCESTASRTERVVVQGTVPSGTYRVTLEGLSCGPGTPTSITTILTVATEAGPVPLCAGVFRNVPVGGVVDCSFEIP